MQPGAYFYGWVIRPWKWGFVIEKGDMMNVPLYLIRCLYPFPYSPVPTKDAVPALLICFLWSSASLQGQQEEIFYWQQCDRNGKRKYFLICWVLSWTGLSRFVLGIHGEEFLSLMTCEWSRQNWRKVGLSSTPLGGPTVVVTQDTFPTLFFFLFVIPLFSEVAQNPGSSSKPSLPSFQRAMSSVPSLPLEPLHSIQSVALSRKRNKCHGESNQHNSAAGFLHRLWSFLLLQGIPQLSSLALTCDRITTPWALWPSELKKYIAVISALETLLLSGSSGWQLVWLLWCFLFFILINQQCFTFIQFLFCHQKSHGNGNEQLSKCVVWTGTWNNPSLLRTCFLWLANGNTDT